MYTMNGYNPIPSYADANESSGNQCNLQRTRSHKFFYKRNKVDLINILNHIHANWVQQHPITLGIDIKDNEFLQHYLTNNELHVNMVDKNNLYYTKFKYEGN